MTQHYEVQHSNSRQRMVAQMAAPSTLVLDSNKSHVKPPNKKNIKKRSNSEQLE